MSVFRPGSHVLFGVLGVAGIGFHELWSDGRSRSDGHEGRSLENRGHGRVGRQKEKEGKHEPSLWGPRKEGARQGKGAVRPD